MARSVGDIVLKIDGKEYDAKSVTPTGKTGRNRLEVMSSDGDKNDWSQGPRSVELEIVVPIRIDDDESFWWDIEDAQVVIVDADGQYRTSYEEYYTSEVGPKFEVNQNAFRTIKGFARPPQRGAQG